MMLDYHIEYMMHNEEIVVVKYLDYRVAFPVGYDWDDIKPIADRLIWEDELGQGSHLLDTGGVEVICLDSSLFK